MKYHFQNFRPLQGVNIVYGIILATITWSHHSLIAGNRKGTIYGLIATICLALVFTFFQGFEYYNAPFTIADSVYGSCFFFSTGFLGSRNL